MAQCGPTLCPAEGAGSSSGSSTRAPSSSLDRSSASSSQDHAQRTRASASASWNAQAYSTQPHATAFATYGVDAREGISGSRAQRGLSLGDDARAISLSALSASDASAAPPLVKVLCSVAASLFAWVGVGFLGSVAAGQEPPELPGLGAVTLPEVCAFGLCGVLLYGWELKARGAFWAVAWPAVEAELDGKISSAGAGFAARVRALADAAPVVELHAPGRDQLENYEIAQWQDETRIAEKDSFEGAPVGLFLVTFPLVLIPGDSSEAAALEHARSRLMDDAHTQVQHGGEERDPLWAGGNVDGSVDAVAVRMRLRWPDGSDTDAPAPEILADGGLADVLQPILLLAAVCLLGLIADLLLPLAFSPLEWPVRKRIFTLRGGTVGQIQFELCASGDLLLDGDEHSLRHANRFWLSEEAWSSLWNTTSELAPKLKWLMRLRRVALYSALAVLVIDLLIGVGAIAGLQEPRFARAAVAIGFIVLLVLLCAVGVADCLAQKWAQAWADSIGQRLEQTAACGVNWNPEGRARGSVILTIEQRMRPDAEAPPTAYVTKRIGDEHPWTVAQSNAGRPPERQAAVRNAITTKIS